MKRLLFPVLSGLVLAASASPALAQDDWDTIRNDSETFAISVPKGYEYAESKIADRVMTLVYPEDPFKKLRVEINSYKGQTDLSHLVKFTTKRLMGAYGSEGEHGLVEGSASRVLNRPSTAEFPFVAYSEVVIQGDWGTVVTLVIHKDLWEDLKVPVWDRILDRFQTFEPPSNKFDLPAGWKRVEGDTHFIIGPVADEGEKVDDATKETRERRLYLISTQWIDEPFWVAVREMMSDKRKFFKKGVLHVFPTRDMYRRAVGERYRDGVNAVYLPETMDKVVAVDGSVGGTLTKQEILGPIAVQYMDRRGGGLQPWIRSGLEQYWSIAATRDPVFPGVKDPEVMKKAKDVLRKKPPKFEELKVMDELTLRELGEKGRMLSYVMVHFQLHADGKNVTIRDSFRRFLRKSADTFDNELLWNELHSEIKDKDIDSAVKKWLRAYKPPKKKR
ncbi:MAG: hypothetical protein ACYTDX_06340 [Planctomycetota bacterium]|jgi:hypothetical protein